MIPYSDTHLVTILISNHLNNELFVCYLNGNQNNEQKFAYQIDLMEYREM